MIPKQQKIALAVLGAAAAAVFGPTVLQQTQQGGDTSAMVPNGPTEEEMAAMTVSVDGPLPALPGTGSQAPTGGTPRAGGSLAPGAAGAEREELGTLLDRLESFGATGRVRSLDEIASEWSAVTGNTGGVTTAAPGALAGVDALSQFLEANPLRATFVFPDDAVALLGPHSVRAGSELLEGHVVVAKVEAQRVTLSVRGVPRVIEMPPVRAAPAAQGTGAVAGGAPNTNDPNAAQGTATNAPAVITPDVP